MELSISRVFSDTFRSVGERFGSLLGVWAVFFGIIIVASVAFATMFSGAIMGVMMAAGGADPGAAGLAGLGGGMLVGLILFYLVLFYLNYSSSAALTSMASLLHRPDIGTAIGAGFRSGLPILGGVLLVAIPAAIVAFVLSMIGGAMGETGSLLVVLLLLVGGLWLMIRIAVFVPVIAVEGERSPIAALRRSWALTEGHALRIFLVFVAVGVALFALILLLGLVVGGSLGGMAAGGAMPGFGTILTIFLLYVLFIAALSILAASLSAALHAQLAGPSGTGLEETFA